jgi:hypothetical protein
MLKIRPLMMIDTTENIYPIPVPPCVCETEQKLTTEANIISSTEMSVITSPDADLKTHPHRPIAKIPPLKIKIIFSNK